jgi:hypothetical protein
MKTASLSLGASQQLEVRQLFDLLKTCLRWEARLSEVFFPSFSRHQIWGVRRKRPESLGESKNRDGHHNTVSPRSPIDHRHILTVSEKLVVHMLASFLVACPISLLVY